MVFLFLPPLPPPPLPRTPPPLRRPCRSEFLNYHGSVLTELDPRLIVAELRPFLITLIANNPTTRNFHALLVALTATLQNNPGLDRIINGLFLVQITLEVSAACAPPSFLLLDPSKPEPALDVLRRFVRAVLTFVSDVDTSPSSPKKHQHLHNLAILMGTRLLLSMGMSQLYQEVPVALVGSILLLDVIAMEGRQGPQAARLVAALLQRVVDQNVLPAGIPLYRFPEKASERDRNAPDSASASSSASTSSMSSVLSRLMNVTLAPVRGVAAVGTRVGEWTGMVEVVPEAELASESLKLLVLLVHLPALPSGQRPYRDAIHALANTSTWIPTTASGGKKEGDEVDRTASSRSTSTSSSSTSASIDNPAATTPLLAGLQDASPSMTADNGQLSNTTLGSLFELITTNLDVEACALLVYALLQGSRTFSAFVTSPACLPKIMLPLLQNLYELGTATSESMNHVYLLLILLLILSQHVSANVLSSLTVSAPWYKERLLRDVRLDSLVLITLFRCAHINMVKIQDEFIQSNAMAVVANIAPHVVSMEPFVAQQLVETTILFAKKICSLTTFLEEHDASDHESDIHDDDHGHHDYEHDEDDESHHHGTGIQHEPPEVLLAQMSLHRPILAMLVEILNNTIRRGVEKNPHLLYALMRRAEALDTVEEALVTSATACSISEGDLQSSLDMVNNFRILAQFAIDKVDMRLAGRVDQDTEDIMVVIRDVLRDGLVEPLGLTFASSELTFSYEEEANPENFFVPYVWQFIVSTSPWMHLTWEQVRLFPSSSGMPD